MTVRITVALADVEAAALRRLCSKFTHSDAQQYLYPHVAREIRSDQAYDMVRATARVGVALEDANVSAWPWIEVRAEVAP